MSGDERHETPELVELHDRRDVIISPRLQSPRHRERAPLADDLARERRTGRARELHGEVGADHARITRDQHRLEIARPLLQQFAAATLSFSTSTSWRPSPSAVDVLRPWQFATASSRRRAASRALAIAIGVTVSLGGHARRAGVPSPRGENLKVNPSAKPTSSRTTASRLLEVFVRLAGKKPTMMSVVTT